MDTFQFQRENTENEQQKNNEQTNKNTQQSKQQQNFHYYDSEEDQEGADDEINYKKLIETANFGTDQQDDDSLQNQVKDNSAKKQKSRENQYSKYLSEQHKYQQLQKQQQNIQQNQQTLKKRENLSQKSQQDFKQQQQQQQQQQFSELQRKLKQLESNKNISDQQLTKMQKEIISLEQQLAKQEAQNQAMKQELDKKKIKFEEEIKQAKNFEKENQKESFSNAQKIRILEQENTEFKKIVSTLQFELEQTQTLYSVEKSKYEKCKESYDDLIVGQEELEEAVFQQKSQIKILEGINKQLSKQNKENLDKIEILSQEQEQAGELDQKFLKQNQILQRKKKEIEQKYYQNQQDHQETVYKLEKIIREQNIKIKKFMDEQELYREQASKENREKMSLQVQLEKEKDSKIKIKSDLGLASIKIQEMVELEKRIQNKNNYIQQLENEIDDLKKKIRLDPNLNFNHDINYYKTSQNEKFDNQNQQKKDYDGEVFGNQKQIVEKIIEKPVYVEKPVEIKVLDKGKERAYENQIYDQKREIDRLESRITEYKNENIKLKELLKNSRQYDQEFAQKQNENMKEKYENQILERDEIINDLKIRQEKLLTEIEFLAKQNIQRNNEVRSFLQEKNSEFQIQNGNQRVCRSFTQGFNPNNISNINTNDDDNQNIYIQESDLDQFQE